MPALMPVDDALTRILAAFARLPAETVALDDAHLRVLAEDITAGHDLPPFANSSMDGYALRSKDVAGAPVRLRVTQDIPAGIAPDQAVLPGEAARIMTGAMLPPGADAVVPVEDTDTHWRAGDDVPLMSEVAILKAARPGANIRHPGDDVRAGQSVLAAGRVLRAAELGVLAGLGRAQVSVIRQPRAAILSSGDELLPPDAPLTPGKIHDMNSYALSGLVREYGGLPIRIDPARDRLDEVRARFHQALAAQPDVILSSAGVSVGTADLVRAVLDELGQVDLWRVNIRPGKPLAYGWVGDVPFFGLPGNPVSAMVTFDVFVRPALLRMGGRPDDSAQVTAVAGEDIASDGRRSYIRVRLAREEGRLIARTTGTQSSGALSSMVLADGLLIIPEGVTQARQGERFAVRILRPEFTE